jgi:hypothetical protein
VLQDDAAEAGSAAVVNAVAAAARTTAVRVRVVLMVGLPGSGGCGADDRENPPTHGHGERLSLPAGVEMNGLLSARCDRKRESLYDTRCQISVPPLPGHSA